MTDTVQDPTVEPWASIKYLLDRCPLAVRCRYKGLEEDLLGSLCTTFIKLEAELRKAPEDRVPVEIKHPGYVRKDGQAYMAAETFEVWREHVAKPGEAAQWRAVQWAQN